MEGVKKLVKEYDFLNRNASGAKDLYSHYERIAEMERIQYKVGELVLTILTNEMRKNGELQS